MEKNSLKVLVTEEIAERGLDALRRDFTVDIRQGLSPDELIRIIPEYDALIIRSATQVDASLLQVADRLRIIGRAGIGLDNVDVAAATKRGVIVANAPQSNIISAAEHTIALLLALCRNIPPADRSLREGKWLRSKFEGVELYEKTLGVLGLGRVGWLVAERCAGFGMRLLAYDPYVSKERAQQLGAQLISKLDDLLSQADFITVHLPKTKETIGIIGKREFELMKPGMRIVNAARGGIIDEEALAEALREGKIAGAALDVFAKEPPSSDNPLLNLPNTVLTPHLGASTEEAQDKAGIAIAEQVATGLKGGFVSTAVNLPVDSMDEVVRPFLTLAEKVGRIFSNMIEGQMEHIEVECAGPIAEHNTSVLTVAALKGIFDRVVHEPVTYVNVPLLAKERGINVTEKKTTKSTEFLNRFRLAAADGGKAVSVAGTMVGPNHERIVEIDGYEVDMAPAPYMAIFKYADRPGIIGKVGTLLGERGINIGNMQVGRRHIKGEAAMVIVVDSPIDDPTMEYIRQTIDASEAKFISL